MPRFTPSLLCTYYKNFPKAYIEKVKKTVPKKVYGNRFGAPAITEYEKNPDEYIYTEHRPWEQQAEMAQRNAEHRKRKRRQYKIIAPKVDRIPDEKWWIFRGDRVEVLVGKDKGKQGLVNYVVRERNWCFVDGLNCKYELIGAVKQMGFSGTLKKIERPLDVRTEVALVDPADLKPTQVEWRWDEKGMRVRCSLRTGYVIPMPMRSEETFEYTTPETYIENDKDTPALDVLDRTFEPALQLFEEEISEVMGIKDLRKPGKTYWY